ncbi:hypothetical protein O181_129564 [Austropuccinia psidii MF-1]|uniref:Uncharacterized protein n=1 Tax=Austropuccinia psidii MF-1 TaxID=1389203 RepID=A0A9Q3Q977_9BASI|nr:hypothetical protein [Austropuccinia psidii MF-1]
MASGSPQRPPAQLKGNISHSSMHPILKDAGVVHIPNSMIPNQGPKIHHQFQRRTLQPISLAIHGGYQKTISGPQPPGPVGFGLAILSGLFQGPFSEVIHHSINCQASRYFNTPGTTQLVHTGSNQSYLYVLGPIGPIHISLW